MHIRKEFYRYVLPSMLAFALSGVYAIADGFFVGNALGDDALAAINVAFPLTAFLQAVGTGIGMGGAVEYAISMGSGDKDRCNRFFGVSLIALFVSGLALTLVFWLFAPQVLSLFGATGSIHQLADEYIRYISLGALFQVLGTGLVPFIRNMGGAVTAMVAMIVGFFANVFLDYLMVWVLPWGMMGAALASVLGQAATFVVCAAFFVVKRQKPRLPYKGEGGHLLKRIVGVGLSPFGLTYSPNITLILINKSAALVGGAAAVTYYAPVSYICTIVVLLLPGRQRWQPAFAQPGPRPRGARKSEAGAHLGLPPLLCHGPGQPGGAHPAAPPDCGPVRRFPRSDPGSGPDLAPVFGRVSARQRIPGHHRLFLCHTQKQAGLCPDLRGARVSLSSCSFCACPPCWAFWAPGHLCPSPSCWPCC